MRQVYIVIDDRTNQLKVFSKRKKAADYIAKQQEPCWFVLKVYKVE